MELAYDRVLNVNVGLIGHVDSGKTTLAKVLSTVASTASFDKNPQSQERGITMDLGFSSFVMGIPSGLLNGPPMRQKSTLQITLVDCPGHASFLKTIISGSKIMHFAMCIIDITHGIQPQTAECIMLADILKIRLIMVITKLDLIPENEDIDAKVVDLTKRIEKTLKKWSHNPCPIAAVDITGKYVQYNLTKLKAILADYVQPSSCDVDPLKFLFAVDHCFNIKGHGTVVTGTVINGSINIKSDLCVAKTNEIRKVKSIQVYRKNVEQICQGDRAGICITQFEANSMERGLLCAPGVVSTLQSFICVLKHFKYYKYPIYTKSKYHISISFDTIVGNVELFEDIDNGINCEEFNTNNSFISTKKLETGSCYALVTLQSPTFYYNMDTIIGLRLDQDISKKICRIAFYGTIIKIVDINQKGTTKEPPPMNIYKIKTKTGYVDKFHKENCVIVKDMFKKESKIDLFIGFHVKFSNDEVGVIEGKFGTSGKIKILLENMDSFLNDNGMLSKNCGIDNNQVKKYTPITVTLKYKQSIHDKSVIYQMI